VTSPVCCSTCSSTISPLTSHRTWGGGRPAMTKRRDEILALIILSARLWSTLMSHYCRMKERAGNEYWPHNSRIKHDFHSLNNCKSIHYSLTILRSREDDYCANVVAAAERTRCFVFYSSIQKISTAKLESNWTSRLRLFVYAYRVYVLYVSEWNWGHNQAIAHSIYFIY
jgi:hypothetical protein